MMKGNSFRIKIFAAVVLIVAAVAIYGRYGAVGTVNDHKPWQHIDKGGFSRHPLDISGSPFRGFSGAGFASSGFKTEEIKIQLSRAVEWREHKMLESLLAKGASVETECREGRTLLLSAIYYGDAAAVKLLLQKGANTGAVDIRTGDGPLHMAARSHIGTESISLLIERGARLDLRNKYGVTPVMASITDFFGGGAVLKIFMANGADLNEKDPVSGAGLLHMAILFNNGSAADLLIDAGADVNMKDKSGATPLFSAVSKNNFRAFEKMLLRGGDPNAKNTNGESLLFYCIRFRNDEFVKLLVKKGSDVKFVDGSRNTALHLAAAAGSEGICRVLISAGCPVDAKNGYEETPLFSAIHSGSPACVELLIKNGAQLTSVNISGITPIQAAESEGRKEMVEILAAAGAKPSKVPAVSVDPVSRQKENAGKIENFRSAAANPARIYMNMPANAPKYLRTPENLPELQQAVLMNMPSAAEALVESGRDISEMNYNKETALDIAMHTNNFEMAELLVRKGAPVDLDNKRTAGFLVASMNSKRIDRVNLILSRSANKKIGDASSIWLIQQAVSCDLADVLRELVSKGADVNAKYANFVSPMNLAFSSKNFRMARTLFELGSDPGWKDNGGLTPMHLIIDAVASESFTDAERLSFMELLISRGADINAAGKRHMSVPDSTPLQLAVIRSDKTAAAFLIKKGAGPDIYNGTDAGSPLHLAAAAGNYELLKMMLEKVPALYGFVERIEKKDGGGFTVFDDIDRLNTPLHSAVRGFLGRGMRTGVGTDGQSGPFDYFKTVDVLLSYGADRNAVNGKGLTPAMLADQADIAAAIVSGMDNELCDRLLAGNALNAYLAEKYAFFEELRIKMKEKLK